MSWEQIINQEKIKKFFQRILPEAVLSNAYCFFGIEGVGKFATALEIIKTASCRNPVHKVGYIESCGSCSACQSILNNKFSNVEYLFSLPAGKSVDKEEGSVFTSLSETVIEEINSKLKNKILNPYTKFSIEGASQIRISQIRELRKNLALSNSLSGRKFVVIINADEMRTEAQNAFLKTLEEPRTDVTFFLLTARLEGLLPTILSRCQQIYFPPLSSEDIAIDLRKKYNLSEDEISIVTRFANGSLTRAYELVEANLKEKRNKMVDILRIALKKELYGHQLSEMVNKLTEGIDKKMARTCLQLLSSWLRDAMIISTSSSRNLIVNADDNDALERFSKKFVKENFSRVFEIIEECDHMIFSNVQIQNVFLNLYLEIRNILL
ncbi:MAG: ATP-binding protein [Candidatus Kapaibacteriota bacterium]